MSHSSSARNFEKILSKEKKQTIRTKIEEEIEMMVNTYPQSASEATEYLKTVDILESKYYRKYSTLEEDCLLSIIHEHREDALRAQKHYMKKEAREQKQYGNDSEDD